MNRKQKNILWFEEINSKDVALVGGKNASLGEMYSQLTKKSLPAGRQGINIPNGFATTSGAFRYFLQKNKISPQLKKIFKNLNINNIKSLQAAGKKARILILEAELPEDLKKEIKKAYKKLGVRDVAVRSSATAEDLPKASFAGQHDTFLNIKGEEDLLKAVKKCMASLFNDRAISYREKQGFSHFEVALSVGVQEMVRSDLGSAGVMFTLDTETGFRDIILINGAWGLGEMVVQGKVIPDEFLVFKSTLKKGYSPVISKDLGTKRRKLVYSKDETKITFVPKKDRNIFTLSEKEVLQLAKWALKIENHYSKRAGKWMPQDIEWAKDGKTNKLYIVQARPETVHATREITSFNQYILKQKGKFLLEGEAIGSKIASGKVRMIPDVSKIRSFKKGEVLVTTITDPDWEPIMKIAKAIITDSGGRTCFAGRTKVLTNRGFITIKDVNERIKEGEEFHIFSYNHVNQKTQWKKIISSQKNKLHSIRIGVSQTGRMKGNFIDVTPNHKFYTYHNRKLRKKPIEKILKDKEGICLVDTIPEEESFYSEEDVKLAYLLGALSTDGSIYLHPGVNSFRRGQIVFTQKESDEKKEFISTVTSYFEELFEKKMIPREKFSQSEIRGRIVTGTATDFRCYSLSIALHLQQMLDELPLRALSFSKEMALNFLAGVLDGDGSFYNNRIQIYVSKKNVLQAIIISCLKLGVMPQVTRNRNILNVQILERMQDILSFSKKIQAQSKTKILGNKLFNAKQILGDICDQVNYRGRIKPYINNNLLIDYRKIKRYVLPLTQGRLKKELNTILNSSLRMQRVNFIKNLGETDVYNLEVEAKNEIDHNYVVFTERYTPLLVSNSHAAIVSRELGVPCIVGTQNATRILRTGKLVTVDCSSGQDGKIFSGQLKFEIKKYNLKKIPKTKTKIMMNIGHPGSAFIRSFLPNSGVGLAREEFIIASQIKIHPLALYYFQKLKDKNLKNKISKLTLGYDDKKEYFIDKLSQGIAKIASAFYPKPVILRFSDFKSNEYSELIGGDIFEPIEANPMLGLRGASRYYDEKFKPAFEMECRAIKRARDVFGLTNLQLMVPFCRTVEEGKRVLKLIKEYGLQKGKDGLKVYVMCEIPSNVISADQFLEIFDGMSIGSNDLTQLVLGLGRDSALVDEVGDERNPAVKKPY